MAIQRQIQIRWAYSRIPCNPYPPPWMVCAMSYEGGMQIPRLPSQQVDSHFYGVSGLWVMRVSTVVACCQSRWRRGASAQGRLDSRLCNALGWPYFYLLKVVRCSDKQSVAVLGQIDRVATDGLPFRYHGMRHCGFIGMRSTWAKGRQVGNGSGRLFPFNSEPKTFLIFPR